MTLNELQKRPLAEAVTDMNLVESKIHTDDDGTVRAVEMKYVPTDSAQHDKGKSGRY